MLKLLFKQSRQAIIVKIIELKDWFSQRQISNIRNFGWRVENAKLFSNSDCLELISDDSDWGYQIVSSSIKVPDNCCGVISAIGILEKGSLCLGVLDESGSAWVATEIISKHHIDTQIVFDPGASNLVSIVISNAQKGSSEININNFELKWVPKRVAHKFGDSEDAIKAEVNSLLIKANPIPLNGVENSDSGIKIDGVGVYLRTDFWVSIKAGGSYGHTCYVAKELATHTNHLICFTANRYELLDEMGLEQRVMDVPFETSNEIDVLRSSRFYYRLLKDQIREMKPSYIYERSILGSYVGAWLSQEFGIPYILEYNGSEISMKKSFDTRGYELEEAYQLIEKFTFSQATTIVAISEVIADGLRKQGVPPEKILVNPNGCSPEDYKPISLDERAKQRAELGWDDGNCVVGFIGTFGGWHGIDVLAEALPILCSSNSNLRFLLIGDGNFRHLIDEVVKKFKLNKQVHLTGVIPQKPAGKLLGCSDILISPHSRNMVDSKFFGSPTKLFEYMALGGAIVASDLEQIGEVLKPSLFPLEVDKVDPSGAQDKLAVLCKPGDTKEFTHAVLALAKRSDLWPILGANARQALISKYTWKQHVEKILAFTKFRKSFG